MENSQALVIVPTVGQMQLLLGCVQRILECTRLPKWSLCVVYNPVDEYKPAGSVLRESVESAVNAFNITSDSECELVWVDCDEAVGWPKAVNSGINYFRESGSLPPFICVMNDDVLVTPFWLTSMIELFSQQGIVLQGELPNNPSAPPVRSMAAYGRLGMVGPLTNECAGQQRIIPPSVKMDNGSSFTVEGGSMLDRFSAQLRSEQQPPAMSCSFLSGFCVVYRKECLEDMLEVNGADVTFLRESFGVGGYDDNDVAARAQMLGWKLAIDRSTYVHHLGHATLHNHFPDADLGRAGAAQYLREWEEETAKEHRLVAVFRVGWQVPWDLAMFGACLRRTLQFVDGVAIVATSNPAQAVSTKKQAQGLPPQELKLIADCYEAQSSDDLHTAVSTYLSNVIKQVEASGAIKHKVSKIARFASNIGNERVERNEAIQLAMRLEPTWCISIDHDEILEPSVDREMMQRLMRHPDPLVTNYDFGWANHWDSDRLCRVDAPWADGYRSSMRGYRMWRVLSKGVLNHQHQRILAGNESGLHCGNVPDCGTWSKRVAGLRFRHYGYMRHADRVRKYARYMKQDPNPDSALTQGGSRAGSYDHLVNEERMILQQYRHDTRIGLTMLCHSKEQIADLYRHLTFSYALVDQIVLVWTEDDFNIPDDLQYIADRFGVTWLHHPLADDISAARNAGVDWLREHGVDWCWVMDPDEHLVPAIDSMVSIRRMVEVSNGWAWLFRFRNYRPGGQWAISENVRLFRLAGGKLRYHNRVHETLERDLHKMSYEGIHPQVRPAPFMVEHMGLSGDDERTQQKLFKYTRLLALQLQDEPTTSPGAWVSLGLQFGNDGDEANQMRCYELACATADNAYLPFREVALTHLRKGKHFLKQALSRLAESHDLHGATQQMVEMLEKIAPDQAKLGSARAGKAIPTELDIDTLIAESWAAVAAKITVNAGNRAVDISGLHANLDSGLQAVETSDDQGEGEEA